MATKTGEVREMLVDAIEAIRNGKLTAAEGNAIANIASQITRSLESEVNTRYARKEYDITDGLGDMAIGEERPALPGLALRITDEGEAQ